MTTLRLSAALAALVVTASTACAAVGDFSNALGPSGGYSSEAYYQTMLGGQPMSAAQQAYSDQEDGLRQQGFQLELGGDFALGQMFYAMAYGVTPPSPGLDGGSGPSSLTPGGGGSWDGSDSSFSDEIDLEVANIDGEGHVFPLPEPSTWAMLLMGFAGLAYARSGRSRKPALPSTPRRRPLAG